MQKLWLFMMVSADGYFEGVDHDLSWHIADDEFHAFCDEQDRSVDAILMGHRTFNLMESFWPTPQGPAVNPETARFMNETPKFVAAHRPFHSEWQKTTVIADNVSAQVKALKERTARDIALLGSNELCVSLMADGLIDEFRIMINPVAIGAGTPIFAGLQKKTKLKLESVRTFESGNVLHTYRAA